jgi:hypothetical protein
MTSDVRRNDVERPLVDSPALCPARQSADGELTPSHRFICRQRRGPARVPSVADQACFYISGHHGCSTYRRARQIGGMQ